MDNIIALLEEARDYIGKVTPHDGPYELANSLDSAIAELRKQKPVAFAGSMPGTDGFTMAAFKAADVPIGTPLYASPVAPVEPIEQLRRWYNAQSDAWHDQGCEFHDILDQFEEERKA
jgi:hypothetical protein